MAMAQRMRRWTIPKAFGLEDATLMPQPLCVTITMLFAIRPKHCTIV